MPAAPTTELGTVNQWATIPGWDVFVGDMAEQVPELRWPNSIKTYERMLDVDAQVRGLALGVTLPIRHFQWSIDPNGADPKVVQGASENFGLPIKGQADYRRGRVRDSFSHDQHLDKALKALFLGFYPFEQVYREVEGGPNGQMLNLRKLAPRHPRTFVGGQIKVADDGGLVSIKQAGIDAKELPVDRLLYYCWDNDDGGNWVGKSMLRSCFRNFLIKDRTLRIGTLNIERNGIGIPVSYGSPDGNDDQLKALDQIGAEAKAGERSSVTLPYGADMKFKGVEGAIPDAAGWIRLNNEEMARAFLEMFMQLGTTQTGSRALGGDLIEFFEYAVESIADWYKDIFTGHMVEDWVDLNWGPDEIAPALSYSRTAEEVTAPMAQSVDAGTLQVDDEVKAALKPTKKRRPSVKAASNGFHREMNQQEVAAKTDFPGMDAALTSAVDDLVAKLLALRGDQITDLLNQIKVANGDINVLAAISATPVGADELSDAMKAMAEAGVEQVMSEAAKQGANPVEPDLEDLTNKLHLRARATSSLLSSSLSQAAANKAVSSSVDTLDPDAVAEMVRQHLESLSDAYLNDQANGVIVAGQNGGRKEVMRQNAQIVKSVYASEILDGNTCEECAAEDGTEWDTVEEAEVAYPSGGCAACLGGPRCRGTLVAVFENETEPSVQ